MSRFERHREALEADGWSLSEAKPEVDEWWCYELWQVESVWSPIGFKLFLTLELDPMAGEIFGRKRAKGALISDNDVWSMSLSPWHPALNNEKAAGINLRPFEESIARLVDIAAEMRTKLGEDWRDKYAKYEQEYFEGHE